MLRNNSVSQQIGGVLCVSLSTTYLLITLYTVPVSLRDPLRQLLSDKETEAPIRGFEPLQFDISLSIL